MRRLLSRLRRFGRDEKGVAAVEFVLVAPVVMVVLVGMADIGTALFMRFQLDSAVSAAVDYAMVNSAKVNSTDGASLASTLASFVASAEGQNWAEGSVVVNGGASAASAGAPPGTAGSADSCYCPTGSAPNITWGAPQTCGAPCSGGGYAGKFVLVSASRSYSPLIPGVGSSGVITSSSMVQVQ